MNDAYAMKTLEQNIERLLLQMNAVHDALGHKQLQLRTGMQAGARADRLLDLCRDVQMLHLLAGELLCETMQAAIQSGASLVGPARHRRPRAGGSDSPRKPAQ